MFAESYFCLVKLSLHYSLSLEIKVFKITTTAEFCISNACIYIHPASTCCGDSLLQSVFALHRYNGSSSLHVVISRYWSPNFGIRVVDFYYSVNAMDFRNYEAVHLTSQFFGQPALQRVSTMRGCLYLLKIIITIKKITISIYSKFKKCLFVVF